jgi:hypothetical protein
VQRDIRHRLADLAVDRDAIWINSYFGISSAMISPSVASM